MKTIPTAAGVALALSAAAIHAASPVSSPARITSLPEVSGEGCRPPPGERPWLNRNQTPECRALEALAALTSQEIIHFGAGGIGLGGTSPPVAPAGAQQPAQLA